MKMRKHELVTSTACYFVAASSVCCVSVRRSPGRGAAYPATRPVLTFWRIYSDPAAAVTFISAFLTSAGSDSLSIASEVLLAA